MCSLRAEKASEKRCLGKGTWKRVRAPVGRRTGAAGTNAQVSNAKGGDLGEKSVCVEDVCGEEDREAGS